VRVLLAGGGTTGHVAPLLALADRLTRRNPGTRVLVLGTASGVEARLVPARGYPLATVDRVPAPRRLSLQGFALPARLARAVGQAGAAMARHRAEVVVGFGGYVATPAYLAARRAGVPIVVHEQNAVPGLANRLGARLTPYVGVTFPGTPLPHAILVGMPLRGEITGLDRLALRAQARHTLGLHPDLPTVFVTGGSSGAAHLNAVTAAAAGAFARAGIQVLHMTGVGKRVDVTPAPGAPPYVVVDYLDRMELGYAAADLLVARAGAGTVCEAAALGLPAVYVPLPIGNGEQRRNAEHVVAAGGGVLVADADLDTARLVAEVQGLLADPARLAAMGAAAAAVGRRDGDERLADLVEAAVSVGRR